jgi:hypothetical protein
MARAQVELGQYNDARTSARRALRLRPADEDTARRLEVVERVIALDPTPARLSDRERARRARLVLNLSGDALLRCVGDDAESEPELTALVEAVTSRRAGRRPADDSAPDLHLAEEAWNRTQARCPGAPADDALPLVMRRLREATS